MLESDELNKIHSIELTSVLQLINMDKKTIALEIEKNHRRGCIYFEKGEIIHAELENISGIDAFFNIVKLNPKTFSIKQLKKISKKTINDKFMELMLKIAVFIDEDKLKQKGGIKMNKEKFETAQKALLEELGDGLLASSFWVTGDGQELVSYSQQKDFKVEVANALFDKVTSVIKKSLKDANFPASLNKYYIMDLSNNMTVAIIQLGNFQWGMLVDKNKTTLGILLNVALPKAMEILQK